MSNAKQPTKQAKSATPSTRAKRTTLSDDDQLAMALAAEGITQDYSQPNNTPASPSAPQQPDQQSNADNRSLREQMEQLEEILAWFDSDEFELEAAVERYQQAARVAEQIDQRLREIKNKVTIITEDAATS
ncbi:MAG: exodeoxyribonuclease VII small subunit [Candidatus Saccharibacteria bacterium]|nr:exodeoxyribonuclease VII small subunit [Candidatus Saccharibacteria bacterium]